MPQAAPNVSRFWGASYIFFDEMFADSKILCTFAPLLVIKR